MQNVMLQKRTLPSGEDVMIPFTPEDVDFIAELKNNQTSVWRLVMKGAFRQREIKQLNLVMAAFRVAVANNPGDPGWVSVEKAKFSTKAAIGYIQADSAIVMPDGRVMLNCRSFSYDALHHKEACKIFDSVLKHIALFLVVPVEKLIEMAKNREY